MPLLSCDSFACDFCFSELCSSELCSSEPLRTNSSVYRPSYATARKNVSLVETTLAVAMQFSNLTDIPDLLSSYIEINLVVPKSGTYYTFLNCLLPWLVCN